ncbi:hypothetical protein NUW58_g8136 [Xylaria curta]|uniref:Uncharacterized protein n=1 Tax=Xylaria curta TaxID=42375 RepID=A0ACC1NB03_9PEZI|nr:hypothetical protein NUW58_g8136 [Xylaria curta]
MPLDVAQQPPTSKPLGRYASVISAFTIYPPAPLPEYTMIGKAELRNWAMGLSTRFPGWRLTGHILSISSVVLTVANIVTLAVYSKWFTIFGERVLYQGSCRTSSQISLVIQLAINVVSSVILASSNFFMQVIAAPTRRDIDAAHEAGVFLDIGVPSSRNLFHIPRINALLWWILGVSSVPVHLLFNSSVVETKTSTDAVVLLASESFLSGEATFTAPGLVASTTIGTLTDEQLETTLDSISQSLRKDSSQWQHIGIDECIKRYNDSGNPLVNYRHVIMVVSDPRRNNITSGWTTGSNGRIMNSADSPNSMGNSLWMSVYLRRGQPVPKYRFTQKEQSDLSSIINLDKDTKALVSSLVFIGGQGASLRADSCVSEVYLGDCRLELIIPLFTIVCGVFTLKSVVAILWMSKKHHHSPLLTIGDAIESFITVPDVNTEGLCTYTRKEFSKINGKRWKGFATKFARPRKYDSRRRALGSSLSKPLWVIYCAVMSILFFGILILFLSSPRDDLNISTFGQSILNPSLSSSDIGKVTAACLSNIHQLTLSIGYMVYNSIFTSLLTEAEWSSYGIECKSLRVTDKKGQQRSTHRLQLPYRYSIPLLVLGILLHWLFSNCLYTAVYSGRLGYTPYEAQPDYGFVGLQVSPIALLITFIALFLVGTFPPFCLARVRRPSAVVVGASCSAVLSAACHCITPGQDYTSLVMIARGHRSPLKPESRLLYSMSSPRSQNPDIREGRGVESHDERTLQVSSTSEQSEGDIQAIPHDVTSPRSNTSETDGNQERSGGLLEEEVAKPKTETFLEEMAQGKLTWGVVWEAPLEEPPRSESASHFQYTWLGSVLVPGTLDTASDHSSNVLAHLSFGTSEQVTGLSDQKYSFA